MQTMRTDGIERAAPPDAGEGIVETRVSYRRDVLWVSLLFGLIAGVGTPIAISFGLSPAVATAVCLPIAMLFHTALERRCARQVRRRIASAEQELQRGSAAPAADSFCQCLAVCARISANSVLTFRFSPLRWVAGARARHGLVGRAVRIADKLEDLPSVGPPLAVPFEPAQLSERSELIVSASGAPPTAGELFRERLQVAMRSFGRSRLARWFFVGCMMLGCLGVIVLLVTTLRDLLQGRQPTSLRPIFIGLAAAAPIAVLVAVITGWRQERWLVVPAAILVRRSSWWSQQSELEIFRRKESVLMYWMDANQLAIGAADGRMSSMPATARMAELAIRAWLSPLQPPAVERLLELGAPATQ